MKKRAIFFVFVILIIVSISACGFNQNGLQENNNSRSTDIVKNCDHSNCDLLSDTATCEAGGTKRTKCSDCGEIIAETSLAKGHNGVIRCSNCNQLFTDIIYDYLVPFTLADKESSYDKVLTFSKQKNANGELTLSFANRYGALSTTITSIFTLKKNGDWDYVTNYVGNIQGTVYKSSISAVITLENLSLYTYYNVDKEKFEVPVEEGTGDSSAWDLLYTSTKSNYALCIKTIDSVCSASNKVTLKNFGFSNY